MSALGADRGPEARALAALLERAARLGASDLHLGAGDVPRARKDGRLFKIEGEASLDAATVDGLAHALMSPGQRDAFARDGSVDLAVSLEGAGRFRVNAFRERGRTALAVRRLDDRPRSLADLRLPASLSELTALKDGLVLVVGPVGSGKSTTLAMMIHAINASRECHILTVEDPIEFVHENVRSLVRQRELHTDVRSFDEAVRAALREDPDVLLIGELRDAATIRAALTAAETGHLVLSTLHSGDSVVAIERAIGAMPIEEQPGARHALSIVLRAVVAQRLLARPDGKGRVPAVEVLRVVPAVANLVRTTKTQQIYSVLETGSSLGMQTFEESLAGLVAEGLAPLDAARRLARDPRAFDERLRTWRERRGAPPAAAAIPGGGA